MVLVGGGFKDVFIFTPKIGEDSHFDEHGSVEKSGPSLETSPSFSQQRHARLNHGMEGRVSRFCLDPTHQKSCEF